MNRCQIECMACDFGFGCVEFRNDWIMIAKRPTVATTTTITITAHTRTHKKAKNAKEKQFDSCSY